MAGRSDQLALWKRTVPAPIWRCSIWLSGSSAGVSVTWHKSVSPQEPVRGVYFSIRVPSEAAPLQVRICVLQLRNLELKKAESHPARRADLGPVPPTWLRDLGITFGMPDLVTPGDDRVA